ncbi:MAG: polysaccharide biosynthesis protein [Treponemataceae bacterium]
MKQRENSQIYIIGAGSAGKKIASEIVKKKIFGKVSAFIDDDPELIGKTINDIPIYGPVSMIPLLKHGAFDEAIIAMPTASKDRIKEVFNILSSAGFAKIKILPSVSQIIENDVHLIQTREIDPLDILGRNPITVSLKESLLYLKGKRVMITGAGGSIGSELSRQMLSAGVERLYLFGHGENSIYHIDRELRLLQAEGVGVQSTIVPLIGDLKDKEYLEWLLPKMKIDVIFHCAAYKHVPLMEENPVAVIENNVFGTINLLEATKKAKVSRFVLISTDKAVLPVSVYGVSKMLCEKLVLDSAKKAAPDQAFMFVRFGNVLGSRGSILPLFMEQIKTGGPVTVTDKNMKRYFITIPEACSLVLKAGGVGKNGISYLLDMGEPIKIIDIAEQIIRFLGFEPKKDIKINFIGTRKGERLDEPLWTSEENPQKTEHEMILKLHSLDAQYFILEDLIEKIRPVCTFNPDNGELFRNKDFLVEQLCKAVPSLRDNYNA